MIVMKNTKSVNKIFSIVLSIVAWLSFFVAVVLSLMVLFSTFSGESDGRTVFGHKMLIVMSDSMTKTEVSKDEKISFNSGDLILIREVTDYSEIEVGDIITFTSYNPQSTGKTLSHKVRSIKTNDEGKLIGYETYGIKTGTSDLAIVEPSTIMGKYVCVFPYLGNLFLYFKTPAGFFTSILIPCLMLIIFFSIRVGKLIGRKELIDKFNEEIKALKDRLFQMEKEGIPMKEVEVTEQNEAKDQVPMQPPCLPPPHPDHSLEMAFNALNNTIESLTRTIESLAATAEKPVETLARTVETLSLASRKSATVDAVNEQTDPIEPDAGQDNVEECTDCDEKQEDLTFSEKIFSLDVDTRTYFSDIHNELVSYENIKYRISNKGISYRVGRNTVANIAIADDKLVFYVSINADKSQKYSSFNEVSSMYNDMLFTVNIISNRSKNKAIRLIDRLAISNGLVKNEQGQRENIFRQLKLFR